MPLQHLVRGQYLKAEWMHSAALTEPVLQTHTVPLAAVAAGADGLDLAELRTVSLVFDGDASGSVLVDDLGFSPEPAA